MIQNLPPSVVLNTKKKLKVSTTPGGTGTLSMQSMIGAKNKATSAYVSPVGSQAVSFMQPTKKSMFVVDNKGGTPQ